MGYYRGKDERKPVNYEGLNKGEQCNFEYQDEKKQGYCER